ncbi:hypothetical protein EAH87_06700 [Sphingomonas koreensis]|nr:hypothetical protein EAH87_06700 [Sphingomonas koreensis]
MTGFDFLFALFSLLLGLAMAEVLGGFAKVLKLHARARAGGQRDVRVGKLVPLMALYVLLGQLTGWTILYNARDGVPFNYVSLIVVTAIVGGYYLLSSLVWPEEPGEWPDFDAYYDQFNRVILAGNLLLTIIGFVVSNAYGPAADPRVLADPVLPWIVLAGWAGAMALNLVLFFVRGRRLNAMLLALLIVLQVGGAVAGVRAGLAEEHPRADQLNDAGRSASRSSGVTAAVASGRKS